MPLSIQSPAKYSDPSFQDPVDAPTAKKDLESVQGYLDGLTASGKKGTLMLVPKKDGSAELQRKRWYHDLFFWSSTIESQTKAATAYVEQLLSVAYKDCPSSTLAFDTAKTDFSNYLTASGGKIRAEEVAKHLEKLQLSELSSLVQPSSSLTSLPTEVRKIHHLDRFLRDELGMTQGQQSIGEGAFGKVYTATLPDDKNEYIYKASNAVETAENLVDMTAASENKHWAQHGDIAASQVKNIQEMTQTKFFIIAHTPDAMFHQRDFYYVPADQVEILKEKLQTASLRAEVIICGQLMTKASGKEVKELLDNKEDFSPDGENFRNVACGLFRFLEQARAADFVHRDIAPKNLMLHEQTGALKVIDFGTSEKLEGKKSRRTTGSPEYMAPSVKRTEKHGSEVDFFSSAMTLLELIHPKEFRRYAEARALLLKEQDLFDHREAGESLLDVYLKTIVDEDGTSATAEALKAHPEIKNLIELAFEVSEGGEKGAAAFEKWQQAFDEYKIASFLASPSQQPSTLVERFFLFLGAFFGSREA